MNKLAYWLGCTSFLFTACHLEASGAFSTTSSTASRSIEGGFRLRGSGRVRAGATLVIYGDFSGVRTSDISFRFRGTARDVSPDRVRASEVWVVVPPEATSGEVRLVIEGTVRWSFSIEVEERVVVRPPRVEAPPPEPPPEVACSVAPSIATVDSSIDIRGRFRGLEAEAVLVEFPGVRKPVRASLEKGRQVSVTVPKGAKTGTIRVLHGSDELCDATLAIAKKDDGLLADAPRGKGLVGNIYKLPENTAALPDFGRMTPVGSIVVPKLDVPPRKFETGFPGVSVDGENLLEWFGIRFEGQLLTEKSGEYEFRVNSDDGVRIYIDGRLVLENDGIHPPSVAHGKVTLEAGEHDIRVDYYQGPRFFIALQLDWKEPSKKAFSTVPKAAFRRGLGPK